MSWFQAEPIMQLLLIFFHSVLLSLLTWGGVASGVSYLPSLFQDICHTEGRKTSSLTPEVTPIRIPASITTTRWDWSTGKAKGWSEFHNFLNFLLSNPSAHASPRAAPFPTPRHRDNQSLNSWTCRNCVACSNTQIAIHAKFPFTLRSFIDQLPCILLGTSSSPINSCNTNKHTVVYWLISPFQLVSSPLTSARAPARCLAHSGPYQSATGECVTCRVTHTTHLPFSAVLEELVTHQQGRVRYSITVYSSPRGSASLSGLLVAGLWSRNPFLEKYTAFYF